MSQPWVWTAALAAVLLATLAVYARLRASSDAGAPGPAASVAPAEPNPGAELLGPEPTEAHPLPDVLLDPAVVAEKGARRLTVFSDGKAVKRYRIALGSEPVIDKEREGDGRTPEGEFYVCSKIAASTYHRAIGLSYPDVEDAERGLAEHLINKHEYRAILDAHKRMQRPPWRTGLGGEIMLHGGGTATDWTQGCIALSDEDAEELFAALPLGTPVGIRR